MVSRKYSCDYVPARVESHLEVQLKGDHEGTWDVGNATEQARPVAVRYNVDPCSCPDESRH